MDVVVDLLLYLQFHSFQNYLYQLVLLSLILFHIQMIKLHKYHNLELDLLKERDNYPLDSKISELKEVIMMDTKDLRNFVMTLSGM